MAALNSNAIMISNSFQFKNDNTAIKSDFV